MNKIGITIFGSTGDLTYRKLMSAFYNLYCRNELVNFDICAIGRRDYTTKEYVDTIIPWIKKYARLNVDDSKLENFLSHINYLNMNFINSLDYVKLDEYYKNKNISNHIVYLAVAPSFFEIISDSICNIKSIINPKIVLEKPFGESLENAKYLSDKLENKFGVNNIYRIDHYLGKEMVRNILDIRESNPIFSNVWNSDSIECVHISALETLGIENRASYYDNTGALKDMIQNHLLQILSIVALDNPKGNLKEEQLKVLKSLRPIDELKIEDSVILAQYDGYLGENGVSENSNTETYAQLKLFIDNYRWSGVPFFIRTGKKCKDREIEVIIKFKRLSKYIDPNILVIKIQPMEGVYLEFNIKTPGEEKGLTKAKMEFCQNCEDIFRINTPEAYERMILACINDDISWFSKWEEIEVSWDYINKLKDIYYSNNLPIYKYEAGSYGPINHNSLAENDDQKWNEGE